ncbi:DUF6265 family protein [Sphingomonas sp. MMS12-HWE2-04]|uniref:DUF6265 family protein n=1 Tax=Sphingomonas sp. MMS12-HWE2-04 TaxID=3234199 RepID=UPI00384C7CED
MLRIAVALMLMGAALPAAAQETRTLAAGAKSPPAKIEQLGWLAGTWRGDGLGGAATEVYSIQAGTIAGHFLQENEQGGALFYELMQIVPRDGSLIYRLRHFGASLKGWEDVTGDAVEFPLIAIEGDAVYFDGMTFRRTGPDEMTVWAKISDQGKEKEMPFRYRRAR